MKKTNIKKKPKALIQKQKILCNNNLKKLSATSSDKFFISKEEKNFRGLSSNKSRNKSSGSNKRNRSREISKEKSKKIIRRSERIRTNNLNNSKIKKIKKINKENSKFLNKKRKKVLDYSFDEEEEKYEESEEDFEEDEETIKSYSEDRLEYLPCRKEEQDKIYNYIKKGLQTNGNYNSLYIAGMPGTGKTASVKTIIM